jgi:glycosyltransferase involved in cell wall biosynthesis
MILVLFTTAYPYVLGGEQNFLAVESQYLLESFERVVLVPEMHLAEQTSYPPQLELEDTYSEYLQSHGRISTFIHGFFSLLFFKEIIRKPWLLFKPAFMKTLIFFAGKAELTRRWVIAWIKKQKLDARHCLFYTYWFDHGAMGIGLAKRNFPNLKLVSRVHGYDLYEERRDPPYWPCREGALSTLDFLFPASDAGREYLEKRYPNSITWMETARLGVPDYGIHTASSSDTICRIVSCSKFVAVKRLDLMLNGIAAAANRRPFQKFHWRHFGTGSPALELEEAIKILPKNVEVDFAGYSTQNELFEYYRENPVDIFMNVSASEGTPVAIMEAISCGIPVIATAVGGNKEIVSERNGYLVSANPSPNELAEALLSYLEKPGNKRTESRAVWSEKYHAKQNYTKFVKCLVEIRA